MKTLRYLTALAYLLAFTTLAVDQLIFLPSPSPGVSYVARWGTAPGMVAGQINIGTNTTFLMTNGPWGVLYYSVVAEASGIQSGPSNEVKGTNTPYAPTQIRVIQNVYLTPP